MNIQKDEWKEDLTLDEVEILFAAQSLAGNPPSATQLIARYPQWADEITNFALDFQAQQARLTQSQASDVPESLRTRLQARLDASRQPARTLNEARKALDWTPDDLAQKLNLPTRIVVSLSRGLIEDWPRRLEHKLSAVLMRPIEQVKALLKNSVVTPAANFSADGPIGAPNLQRVSFRAALEACDRAEPLTSEQKDEWLADEAD